MKCISQARVPEQYAKACDNEELLSSHTSTPPQSTGLTLKVCAKRRSIIKKWHVGCFY